MLPSCRLAALIPSCELAAFVCRLLKVWQLLMFTCFIPTLPGKCRLLRILKDLSRRVEEIWKELVCAWCCTFTSFIAFTHQQPWRTKGPLTSTSSECGCTEGCVHGISRQSFCSSCFEGAMMLVPRRLIGNRKSVMRSEDQHRSSEGTCKSPLVANELTAKVAFL